MTRQSADVEVRSSLSNVIVIDIFEKSNMNSVERGEIICLACKHRADCSCSCALYTG